MGYNLLKNGIYYPFTNHLLTSWDIQLDPKNITFRNLPLMEVFFGLHNLTPPGNRILPLVYFNRETLKALNLRGRNFKRNARSNGENGRS